MTEELNRFQKDRAKEMGDLLRQFALAQAAAAAENARAWSLMLQDMQATAAPAPAGVPVSGAGLVA
jgi:hypothetical protein